MPLHFGDAVATLANVRVLIGLDPPQAQAMLDRLIAFLRATLNASRTAPHPWHRPMPRFSMDSRWPGDR